MIKARKFTCAGAVGFAVVQLKMTKKKSIFIRCWLTLARIRLTVTNAFGMLSCLSLLCCWIKR